MKTGIKLLSLPEPFLPLNRASLSHSTTAERGGGTQLGGKSSGRILQQYLCLKYLIVCNKDFFKYSPDQISKHVFLNKLLTAEN